MPGQLCSAASEAVSPTPRWLSAGTRLLVNTGRDAQPELYGSGDFEKSSVLRGRACAAEGSDADHPGRAGSFATPQVADASSRDLGSQLSMGDTTRLCAS
jgi:hypothetical protein